jgi:hypothetical protein
MSLSFAATLDISEPRILDIFLTVQLCEQPDSIDCAIAKPNQAGNSIWKVPGGGEQAHPHNNRPDPP